MLKILDTTIGGVMLVARVFSTACYSDSQKSYTLCTRMILG